MIKVMIMMKVMIKVMIIIRTLIIFTKYLFSVVLEAAMANSQSQ